MAQYRFVCLLKPNNILFSGSSKEYANRFPTDFFKYAEVSFEEKKGLIFDKIGDLHENDGDLSVVVPKENAEIVFRTNIFCTLVQNQVEWETMKKYSLRTVAIKQ